MNLVVFQVVENDCHPKWRLRATVNAPLSLMQDPRRHLIVKVWHRPSSAADAGQTELDDHVVGFGAVDVSPLLKGKLSSLTLHILFGIPQLQMYFWAHVYTPYLKFEFLFTH